MAHFSSVRYGKGYGINLIRSECARIAGDPAYFLSRGGSTLVGDGVGLLLHDLLNAL